MDAPVKALNTEKDKALAAALAQIEKQFGKGSIMRLGEGEAVEDIQVVSTGSLGLDRNSESPNRKESVTGSSVRSQVVSTSQRMSRSR